MCGVPTYLFEYLIFHWVCVCVRDTRLFKNHSLFHVDIIASEIWRERDEI